ncbi:hypothetical protein AB0067_27430, partial [Klebsiella pneumoniae]
MHVTVLTRDADAFVSRHPMQARRRWLTLVGGSLSALQPLSDDVTDVIHAAADTHMGSGRADWVDQIVGGTGALLAASHGISGRFLLVSSGAVYGP